MPCNAVKQLVDIVYPVWNDAFIYLFFSFFFSIGLVSSFLKYIPRSDTDATSLFQQWSSATGWFFQYARRDSNLQLNFKRKKSKVHIKFVTLLGALFVSMGYLGLRVQKLTALPSVWPKMSWPSLRVHWYKHLVDSAFWLLGFYGVMEGGGKMTWAAHNCH